MAACAPIPFLPRDESEVTEHEIKELLSRHATRKDIIEMHGMPLRYRKNEISYLVCRREGGVLYVVGMFAYVGVIGQSGGHLKCNEYILSFNADDLLIGIHEVPPEWALDRHAEDLNLRTLGKQGDHIAEELWKKSSTYYTSKQEDIERERSEDEKKYIIEKNELAINLKKHAETGDARAQFELYLLEDKAPLKWLCRSADQGYMRAEMWLGYLYETGSNGCPRDYPRSYLWYRRAAIGEHQKEVDKLIDKIEKKKPKLYFCKGISCEIARNIVYLEGKLSAEDVSRAESMLKQWKPGQCERELVGTDRKSEIK